MFTQMMQFDERIVSRILQTLSGTGYSQIVASGSDRLMFATVGALGEGTITYQCYLYNSSTELFETEGSSFVSISTDDDNINEVGANGRYYMTDDIFVAGLPKETVSGFTSAGKIEVYTRSGTVWTLNQTIDNPTPANDEQFGRQIRCDTDSMLVSLSNTTNTVFSVQNWERSGGTFTYIEDLPITEDGTAFQHRFDIFGNDCVMSVNSTHYVRFYERTAAGSSWTFVEELTTGYANMTLDDGICVVHDSANDQFKFLEKLAGSPNTWNNEVNTIPVPATHTDLNIIGAHFLDSTNVVIGSNDDSPVTHESYFTIAEFSGGTWSELYNYTPALYPGFQQGPRGLMKPTGFDVAFNPIFIDGNEIYQETG